MYFKISSAECLPFCSGHYDIINSWWPNDTICHMVSLGHHELMKSLWPEQNAYGDRDLGQNWLRWWLVAWRHRAITWTSVDLPSVRSIGIHLTTILQEILQPSITKISWKITILKFLWNLPGANELKTLISYSWKMNDILMTDKPV